MRGRIVHNDLLCKLPPNEHSGNESCLMWVEDTDDEVEEIAYYKRGPQGNMVADFRAGYHARYGRGDSRRLLGTSGITDRRDNRDPEAMYRELHGADSKAGSPGKIVEWVEGANISNGKVEKFGA